MADGFDSVKMDGVHFNIAQQHKFNLGLKLLAESLSPVARNTMFQSDNLIAWNRNLSFLRDDFFLEILNDTENEGFEKATIWRTYILLYFARVASRLEGDFVELGCHTGYNAANVVRWLDFGALDKRYFLYDLFARSIGDANPAPNAHSTLKALDDPLMHEKVVARFKEHPFVAVIKGRVPDSFAEGFPERIAFAHIDMNSPEPEATALRRILPCLTPDGIVVFDDYGWFGYREQKIALDPIVAEFGQAPILELPTGQGLLIKQHA